MNAHLPTPQNRKMGQGVGKGRIASLPKATMPKGNGAWQSPQAVQVH